MLHRKMLSLRGENKTEQRDTASGHGGTCFLTPALEQNLCEVEVSLAYIDSTNKNMKWLREEGL